MTKLYKFRTFTTSYYFPKVKKETTFLYGLYSPFGGILSRTYWYLFKRCHIVRFLTGTDSCNVDFPYEKIKAIEGQDSLMSFNMGSPGVEQKISILGWDKNLKKEFFAKFSQKPKAIELTKNEIAVYKLLSGTGLVPKLLQEKIGDGFAFLKTEFVKGVRPKSTDLTDEIINLSIKLSIYHLTNTKIDDEGLVIALSHGDFCPWNMLVHDGKIRLIDWELATDRPLGHDLFTYIIQASLLLNPEKNLNEVIVSNSDNIKKYFVAFGIKEYMPYLKAFVDERKQYEFSKGNKERAERLNEIVIR